MNYTYILTCTDGTLYYDRINNLDKRLKAHNSGKGTKYTRPRRPVVLSYYETFETKTEAMKRKYAIKHLIRKQKEILMRRDGGLGQGMGGQYWSDPATIHKTDI